jgi:mannose-1-phosphate guanylyltransferase
MDDRILPVILAGGTGTRLWPMSRVEMPKQFLPIADAASLFQQTLKRVADGNKFHPALILTHGQYRFLVAEQAINVSAVLSGILLEPTARNTAPAISAAACFAKSKFGSEVKLLVLPSDHHLVDNGLFQEAVDLAAAQAGAGKLVTFGIEPIGPETGYGYIQRGQSIGGGAYEVTRFIEKPNHAKAIEMIATGDFWWNSGMFLLKAEAFLDECRAFNPEILAAVEPAVRKAKADLDFIRLDEAAFAASPNISVDYAVFEHTKAAAIVPARFEWSDLGSWDAVWKAGEKDAESNVVLGSATLKNVSGSLVTSDKAHVVVAGLDDVVVVATEDAIFVGKLSDAQVVGTLVGMLKERPETAGLTETHRTSYRPWGGYSSLIVGERYQVKRLFVNPGKSLSLQRHRHRSEHWVVVRGTAEVTVGPKIEILSENQSIYVPLGEVHRLANRGKIPLELVEVQTGSYLGEDDIERFDDEFGRAKEHA